LVTKIDLVNADQLSKVYQDISSGIKKSKDDPIRVIRVNNQSEAVECSRFTHENAIPIF
jgi:GTPase